MENILIIGSEGQLGSELEDYLVSLYGRKKIYSSDIKKNNSNSENFIVLDALDKDDIYNTIKENNIKLNTSKLYASKMIDHDSGKQIPIDRALYKIQCIKSFHD